MIDLFLGDKLFRSPLNLCSPLRRQIVEDYFSKRFEARSSFLSMASAGGAPVALVVPIAGLGEVGVRVSDVCPFHDTTPQTERIDFLDADCWLALYAWPNGSFPVRSRRQSPGSGQWCDAATVAVPCPQ